MLQSLDSLVETIKFSFWPFDLNSVLHETISDHVHCYSCNQWKYVGNTLSGQNINTKTVNTGLGPLMFVFSSFENKPVSGLDIQSVQEQGGDPPLSNKMQCRSLKSNYL